MRHFLRNIKFRIYRVWNDVTHFFRRLRFAYQRVSRGWDDSQVWNMDSWLCETLPPMLRRLQTGYGHPIDLTDDEWKAALDAMIAGFEAGKKILDGELPIYLEYAEINLARRRNTHRPEMTLEEEFAEHHTTMESLGGQERVKREYAELQETFDKGMALFVKHFFSLWD